MLAGTASIRFCFACIEANLLSKFIVLIARLCSTATQKRADESMLVVAAFDEMFITAFLLRRAHAIIT